MISASASSTQAASRRHGAGALDSTSADAPLVVRKASFATMSFDTSTVGVVGVDMAISWVAGELPAGMEMSVGDSADVTVFVGGDGRCCWTVAAWAGGADVKIGTATVLTVAVGGTNETAAAGAEGSFNPVAAVGRNLVSIIELVVAMATSGFIGEVALASAFVLVGGPMTICFISFGFCSTGGLAGVVATTGEGFRSVGIV